MKYVWTWMLAGMLCLCTACSEEPDTVPDTETLPAPTETELSGDIPVTEAATETDTEIPQLPTASEKWLKYTSHDVYGDKLTDIPYYQKLQLKGTEYRSILSMLGGIEQCFYEVKPVSKELTQQILAAADGFCEEEVTEDDLYCIMQDGNTLSLSDVTDYSSIQKVYSGIGVTYDAAEHTMELWTPLHERPFISEEVLSGYDYFTVYSSNHEATTSTFHLADGDFNKIQIEFPASQFLDSKEADAWMKPFLPVYTPKLWRATIRTFEDGTQGIYQEYGLYSRDIPLVCDTGQTADEKDREIIGMTVTIGILQSGRVDYFKCNTIYADTPDSTNLTDPRDYMEGYTLLSYEDACAIADETLTDSRTPRRIQLQYATEVLYDMNRKAAGYVLTPIWHFVFPTETENVDCIDIDAVTKDVFLRTCIDEDTGYTPYLYE